ncbi:MAG: PIG-L family deacetylase [Acidobacteriota bacterium]|nr:PIG-L family deacetylase [Acidobacteriota bacterium]
MRIMCIQAHPDDAEILAGGTLALLSQAGHSITIVTMTAGDCGSKTQGSKEIAEIRRGEGAAAAGVIGAEYVCGGFEDLAIFNDDPSRRRVAEILRANRPDVVITASQVDYLCDHEATSALVRDACFAASVPNYATHADNAAAPLDAIPHLYFADPVATPSEPDFVVDVRETFEIKRRMLSMHASQREWLRAQHGIDDYLETMERWSRERGLLVGVHYGEGFRRYSGHPYPQSPLLEETIEEHVIIHARRHSGA